ncbi:MAG: TOBE domain-containing protein, partial [Thermoplasmata archaeon]
HSDNGFRFEAVWGKFEIDKSVAEAIIETKLNKSTITYGIRPEDVKVYTSAMPNSIPATIYGIELLGDSGLAYIRLDENTEIIAQTEPDMRLGMNDRVYVDISSNRAHIFDSEGIAVV